MSERKGDIESVNLDDWRESQEDTASSEGWKPLDQWEGDPLDWVDAPEFNVRGSLMKRIQRQSKKIQTLEQQHHEQINAIKQLGEHNRKLAEYEYQKAINDLRGRKKEALDVGDSESIIAIDDQLDRLKTAQASNASAPRSQQSVEDVHPRGEEIAEELVAWVRKPGNEWFESDHEARTRFLQAGDVILGDDPDIDVASLFRKATKQAGISKPTSRPNVAAVDDSGDGTAKSRVQPSSKRSKYSSRNLNEEQLQIARTLARTDALQDESGKLTEKQQIELYAQQLGEMGELE
jgi:hypothetical protein